MLGTQAVDYLYASTRVRALEKNMLTSRDLEKMLDCISFEESYKVANDISLSSRLPADQYEAAINEMLLAQYALVDSLTESPEVFSLFRFKYDGHNLKVLVKSQALGTDPAPVMSALSLIPPEKLSVMFTAGKIEGLPQEMITAAFLARDTLAKTHDPQAVDTLLDHAVLLSMLEAANELAHPFLCKVVRCYVDLENLRTTVRLKRIGKDQAALQKVLVPGGDLDIARLTAAFSTEGLEAIREALFTTDYYNAIAPLLDDLSPKKPLTAFERGLDNYMIELLRSTRLVAFGLDPVIAYLLAKENEAKLVRIVLASRQAGVKREKISERLREAYA